ncbi:aminotransferase class III-fold pyridoxal phosphate-dependent enzyme [candidate division KSB3 bacterium]|uniref:glutamate-1-semialdehyde 2,1-aminomutase n=1 Tax=candidate division KSB3 bacterium TaxID=2044937 RepID=A0A9D5Q6R0_9BACT|nr:aminotransferase class III-fold pyridoxal phosphate-dependent enzyme [candidate division KSB3 bacterium]
MNTDLFECASQYLVGGVSSSIRLNPVLGFPFYVSRGDGARLYDRDGREFLDLNMSYGASLLGHNHPRIIQAIQRALEMGIICANETEYHSQLAKKIVDLTPCADLVRFTCSGTEATMHCIRLAREFTGKDKILKFEGHFHGYHDYVDYSVHPPLELAGPAEQPATYIESGGVPAGMKDYVLVVPFNDLDRFEATLKAHKDEIAAVILEPVNYNSGCIVPYPGYLEALRTLTQEHDVLLIFDEVLSAFRMGASSAQGYFDVTPDLCTLGKAVGGGGAPLSVFAGKREIMQHLRPLGNAQHSGTYNGHLVAVMAGLAALEEIASEGFYDHIFALADRLYSGLTDIFTASSLPIRVQGLGARFGLYFGIDEEVTDYRIAAKNDHELAAKFHKAVHDQGVYMVPFSHHGFSAAHTLQDIEDALQKIAAAVTRMETMQ